LAATINLLKAVDYTHAAISLRSIHVKVLVIFVSVVIALAEVFRLFRHLYFSVVFKKGRIRMKVVKVIFTKVYSVINAPVFWILVFTLRTLSKFFM
jgi:hypothetical protein